MPINRTQLRLNAFNRKRRRFGEDLCDLIGPTQVSDGHNGHTIQDATLASDIKCYVEQVSSGMQVTVNEVTRTTTHRIVMEPTDESRLVNEHYQIKVLARINPEMIFEQPVREIESFSPLVSVQAVFTSGFRRPGTQ